MKLKKALSGILAAAMVVSLTPAMAFATTTNAVSNVQTFNKADNQTASVELKIANAVDTPAWQNENHDITLKLNNAKWMDGADTSSKLTASNVSTVVQANLLDKDGTNQGALTVSYLSSDSVTLNVPDTVGGHSLVTGDIIKLLFTFSTKSSSTDEDVTISISDDDGAITSGTYTLGTVVTGKTTAKVADAGTDDLATLIVRSQAQTASDITIKEATSGCLGASQPQVITLTLPSEVEWNAATTVSGSMVAPSPAPVVTIDPTNKRKVTVSFTTSSVTTARRTLTISPSVNTTKNASLGEVAVTLRKTTGDISEASNLIIGKIGETAVKVYVDEEDFKDNKLPELYSGIVYDTETIGSDMETYAVITLEETGYKDITGDKWIDFTFDKSVQVAGNALNKAVYTIDGTPSVAGLENNQITYDKNRNTIGWQVPASFNAGANATSKQKVKLYVPITVEAGFEGDINCTVSGEAAGVTETTVVIGTAKPVVTIQHEVSEVRTGIQNQSLKDIVIAETELGSLADNFSNAYFDSAAAASGIYKGTADSHTYDANSQTKSEIIVEFPFALKDKPTVKVTTGDLDIEEVEWAYAGSKDAIKIQIKADSVKEASAITISDINVTLSRTPAEGGYDINVYGTAVLQNAGFGKDQAFADSYVLKDAVKVITPADSTTVSEKVQATFVIGESSYTNNGAATEMDAAPYIDSHNRTMVPIRYVANACGISENDIRWEQNTQTAIINGLNTVVTVKMGSNKLQTSTGEITMDTAAVNNNGRIYVPVRYIANALGANVSWDAATKTVTLTK